MKLNVGCGRDYREGWINIDISREVKADAIADIRTWELPRDNKGNYDSRIKDEEVDEIYISGVLEQIGENDHLIHAMNECHRVLKPGGKMVVVVPNAQYAIAHRDPMDVRKFTKATFFYFGERETEYKLYGSVYGFKPWKDIDIQENGRHIMTVTMFKV